MVITPGIGPGRTPQPGGATPPGPAPAGIRFDDNILQWLGAAAGEGAWAAAPGGRAVGGWLDEDQTPPGPDVKAGDQDPAEGVPSLGLVALTLWLDQPAREVSASRQVPDSPGRGDEPSGGVVSAVMSHTLDAVAEASPPAADALAAPPSEARLDAAGDDLALPTPSNRDDAGPPAPSLADLPPIADDTGSDLRAASAPPAAPSDRPAALAPREGPPPLPQASSALPGIAAEAAAALSSGATNLGAPASPSRDERSVTAPAVAAHATRRLVSSTDRRIAAAAPSAWAPPRAAAPETQAATFQPGASPAPAAIAGHSEDTPEATTRTARPALFLHAPVAVSPERTPSAAAPRVEASIAAPPVPAEAGLADQIVHSLHLHATAGGGEARVQLRPEYLGEVTVRVVVEHGMVSARLEADTPSVREWIDRHAVSLRDALGEHGLTLQELTVADPRESGGWADSASRERPSEEPPERQRRPRRPAGEGGPRFEVTA